MNTFIAIGTFNALFFALLVLKKQGQVLPDRILAFFFLCNGLALATIYAIMQWGYDDLLLLLAFGNLFFAPLLYLYVATMVDRDHQLPKRWGLYFLPYGLSIIYMVTIISSYSEVELILIFEGRAFNQRTLLHNIFFLIDLLSQPIALTMAWRLLHQHKARIADRYSYYHSIDYHWMRKLIIIMTFSWVLIDLPWVGWYLFEGLNERKMLQISGILYSIVILYAGYYGFRQTPVYIDSDDQPEVLPQESTDIASRRYQKSGLSDEELRTYKERLLEHMQQKEPHLDSNLTIRELAADVGLTEHNISELLNVGLDKRFYDFINNYRVDEFKKRIAQPEYQAQTILAVALQCGFNSKSSFNRIFKQHAGITPSTYAKSL